MVPYETKMKDDDIIVTPIAVPVMVNNMGLQRLPKQKSYTLNEIDIIALKGEGYPSGLAKTLSHNNFAFPLRIWVVDNSGSMSIRDGHRLVEAGSQNKMKLVDCTRWSEIQQTVEQHSRIASRLRAQTEFRFLNNPGRGLDQEFSIGHRGDHMINHDLSVALRTIRNSTPGGFTPLTHHVHQIHSSIMSMESSLRESGSKVAIILATDGLPSDSRGYCDKNSILEFKEALRALEGLPVWIVVRLCTDDEQVVKFYNKLDEDLELSLEVLDDFTQEAVEVNKCNKWLTYGLPLHRCREMGYHNRLFDLLDERQLGMDELRDFFILLFGAENFDGVPDPQGDWKGFMRNITTIVEKEGKQWNPITKKMMPWVDLKKLDKVYRPKRQFFR